MATWEARHHECRSFRCDLTRVGMFQRCDCLHDRSRQGRGTAGALRATRRRTTGVDMFLSRTALIARRTLGVRLVAVVMAAGGPACSPSVAPETPDAAPVMMPDATHQNQDPDPTASCDTDVADFIYFLARQGNAST